MSYQAVLELNNLPQFTEESDASCGRLAMDFLQTHRAEIKNVLAEIHPSHKRFEYQVLTINRGEGIDPSHSFNQAAKKGYRISHVVEDGDRAVIILERETE